jgi:iron complex outermembrane receptor protein
LIAGKIVQGPGNTATYSKTGGVLTCNLGGTGGPYFCGQLSSINAYEQQNPLLISVYDRIDPVTAYRDIQNGPVKQSQTGVVEPYPQPFNPDWLQHLGLKRQLETAHLKMDYDFDSGWTISSITSWDRTKFETIEDQNYEDASEVPNPFYAGSTAANPLLPYDAHPLEVSSITTDYYEELRTTTPSDFLLQGLHGTLGVSYLHIENPGSGLTGFGISGTVQNSVVYTESSTPALFGGLYYEFIPDLTLSVEARYQWDMIAQQTLFPIVAPVGGPATSTYTSFSPHVSLSYKYAEDSIVYALFSRGFEPGGYNASLTGGSAYVQTQLTSAGAQAFYQQEKFDNYEIGIKSTFWDRRIQTSLALYHDIWDNGQVTQTFFVNSPTPPYGLLGQFSVITNIGKVDLNGAELSARVAVTNHFTVNATADYSESNIVQYVNLGAVRVDGSSNVNGKTLAQDPKWTFSVSPQYTDNLIGDWDWHARVDGTYRDRYYIDDTDVAWAAPLLLFDAHIGVSKDKFTIDGYVKNLFNNNTIPEALAGSGESNVIQNNVSQNAIRIGVPDKRTFGIKASYAF